MVGHSIGARSRKACSAEIHETLVAAGEMGRYNPGYKHWIEGCLQHGGSLYIGRVKNPGDLTLDQVEAFLIARYPSKMNKRELGALRIDPIEHEVDVPLSILAPGS